MKVKALKSFAGLVTMAQGQEKVIEDKNILNDLLSAGYVEEVKENAEESPLRPSGTSPRGRGKDSKSKKGEST